LLPAGSSDGTVQEWMGDVVTHCMAGHTAGVTAIALRVGDDMQQLCSTSIDKTVRIWRVDAAAADRPCTHVLQGHMLIVGACVGVPGGFLTGGYEATIRLWDTVEPKDAAATALPGPVREDTAYITALRHHRRPILCMERHGDLVFTGSHDCRVCVWQTPRTGDPQPPPLPDGAVDPALLMCIENAHEGGVSALAFRDGRLYTGAWDKEIRVWEPPALPTLIPATAPSGEEGGGDGAIEGDH